MKPADRLRNEVRLFSRLDWQDHVSLARQSADALDAAEAAISDFLHDDSVLTRANLIIALSDLRGEKAG